MHDHHRSPRKWDGVERSRQKVNGLSRLNRFFWTDDLILRLDVCARNFAAATAAMGAHHSECDGEQIRAEGTTEIYILPVTMQNDEDLLGKVFDIGAFRAEPSQSVKKVVELPLVNR